MSALPAVPAPAPALPDLRDEILRMHAQQRQLSDYLQSSMTRAVPLPPARVQELTRQSVRLTATFSARLREVFRRHGWPTAPLVGVEAAAAVFAIVQSANLDPDFQQHALGVLDAALAAGADVVRERAFIVDCVRVGKGQRQLYGTSLRIVDGDVVPTPIEDPGAVDERRASVGLPPLDGHLAEVRALYQTQLAA